MSSTTEQKHTPGQFHTYCLGVGCMVKCDTCQNEKNWQTLNEMHDELRLPLQRSMRSIDTTACQITNGRFYDPIAKATGEPNEQ